MFCLDKMLVTRIQVLIILLKLLLSFANGNSEKLTKTSDVNHQIPSESEVKNPQTETNHQPTLALLVSVKPNGATQSGGDENIHSITLASDELAGSKENRESMHDKLVQTLLDNGDAKNVNSFGQTSEEVMEKNHMENKHQELWDLLDSLLKRKHELDKEITKKDSYNSDSLEDPDSADSKAGGSHEYEEYDPPYRNVKISKRKAQDDRKHHKDYSYDFYKFFAQSQSNLKNDKKYDLSDEDGTCEDSMTDDQEYDSKEDAKEKQRRNTVKISKIMDNGLKRVYQLELEAKKRKQEDNNGFGRGKNCENESNLDLSSYEQTNLRSCYKRSSKETPIQDKIKNSRSKTAAEKKPKDKLKEFEKNNVSPYEKLVIKKQPKQVNDNLKQKKNLKRKRRLQNIENFSKENTLRLKTRRRPPLKYVNSAERKRLLDMSDCSEQILPKNFRDTKRTTELRRERNKDISNDQNIKENSHKFTLKKNPYRKKLSNYDNFESDTKPIRRKPRQHTPYTLSDEDSFEELNEPKSEYIDNIEKHRKKRSYKRRDRDQAIDSSSSGEMDGQYSNYDIDRVDWSEFDQYLNPYDNFDRKIAEIFRRYDRGISSDIDNSYEYTEDKRKQKPKLIQVINEERNDRHSVKDDKSSLEQHDETNQDAHAIRLSTDLENMMADSKEFAAATEDIGTTTLDKDIGKIDKLTESPIYAKKGVRIPLKLVQDEDGNYNLQVDMKYLCKKCTKKCSKRKRGKKVESKTT